MSTIAVFYIHRVSLLSHFTLLLPLGVNFHPTNAPSSSHHSLFTQNSLHLKTPFHIYLIIRLKINLIQYFFLFSSFLTFFSHFGLHKSLSSSRHSFLIINSLLLKTLFFTFLDYLDYKLF